ncbi:hypothetical protein [Nocardioides sp. T2.26MG-1]|uniref:hypothetical protein n=1 Tax=Nocardioides sp. T2.26MG-1 TaxID=3041166 RepID=UPI00247734E7|nr:hypothetical protein [Nocardioides sp. T2.26MG-1]CAI9414397.1 hypothetical protein HIDPHFAB_02259 [Nocardioides sp. T2.26MG-1]
MTDLVTGEQRVYVVTDIETDGPWPGANSMRSLASVAVSPDGVEHGRFEAVLEELPGAAPNVDTFAWFQTEPEAWAAATDDPEPVPEVMRRYVAWLDALPRPRAFAASPLSFDGGWIDYYLRRFTRYAVSPGPYEKDRLFDGPALCLRSYAAAVTGRPPAELSAPNLPPEWLGDVEHTHQAIDDAVGFANLLVTLFGMTARRPPGRG